MLLFVNHFIKTDGNNILNQVKHCLNNNNVPIVAIVNIIESNNRLNMTPFCHMFLFQVHVQNLKYLYTLI